MATVAEYFSGSPDSSNDVYDHDVGSRRSTAPRLRWTQPKSLSKTNKCST